MYTNADGLVNKRHDLKLVLDGMKDKPNIIAITEIKPKKLKGLILQSEFHLEGYQSFCVGLEDRSARGLILYVDNKLKASLVDIPTTFKECMFVIVHGVDNENFLISNIYRSPSSQEENDEKLFKLIKFLNEKYKIPTVLVGDFNFRDIKWDTELIDFKGLNASEINFVKSIRENFFYQHIDKPTRQRGEDEPHILDLIITSENFVSEIQYDSPIGCSDHAVISFNCDVWTVNAKKANNYRFDKGGYEKLREHLTTDWELENSESMSVD